MGSVGGGRTRWDTNPDNNWSKTPLIALSQHSMLEEVGWLNGGVLDVPCLDKVMNCRTNNMPDPIQWGIEDSTQ